jgi:hypothetical protein
VAGADYFGRSISGAPAHRLQRDSDRCRGYLNCCDVAVKASRQVLRFEDGEADLEVLTTTKPMQTLVEAEFY